MKIILTMDDVCKAVREHLIRRGFRAPEVSEETYVIAQDFSMEISDIDIASIPLQVPSDPTPPMLRTVSVQPGVAPAGRFDPVPSPPREKLDAPDRVLDEHGETLPERLENEQGIKGQVAKSRELAAQDPKKHRSARDRFPTTQIAEDIEHLGKDPTDFKDEL